MKVNAYILFVCAAAGFSGIFFGYDAAMMAGSIGYFSEYFNLTNTMMGFTVSSALIGGIIGARITGYISDKYGRKKTLLIAAFIVGFYAILAAISSSFALFVFIRFIGGIGIAMAALMGPMYVSEISPAKTRGIFVTFNSVALTFGILAGYLVNSQIAFLGDQAWNLAHGWRWMIGSELVPVAIFLVSLLFIPESPRWLVKQNRVKDARDVLIRARDTQEEANIELLAIESSLVVEKENKHLKVNLLQGNLRKLFFIGITLAFIQQACGMNGVIYYATEILKQLQIGGGGERAAFYQSIMIGAVNFLATFIAIFTIDKFGRKKLMIIGSTGIGLAMILIAYNIFIGNVGTMLLVFLLAYIALFAFTFGPVVWLLLAEIFPTNVRAKAMGICVMVIWISNMLVAQAFPMLNGNAFLMETFNGAFPFLLFGTVALLSIPFSIKYVPETKGKTLESIQEDMTASSVKPVMKEMVV